MVDNPQEPSTADDPEHAHKIKLSLNQLGLAGFPCTLIMRPLFPVGDPRNLGGPAGLPGQYEVTFVLARPGYPLGPERTVLWAEEVQGDSHLQIARSVDQRDASSDVHAIRLETVKEGKKVFFIGHPNDRGFLGKLVSDPFPASSSKEALSTAFRLLSPWFSRLAFELETPLQVYSQEVHELRTGTRAVIYISPQEERNLAGSLMESATDLERQVYYSIYREAQASQAPVHQFFCYYRIIEGLNVRHARLCQEANRAKIAPPMRPRLKIPGDKNTLKCWLNQVFGQQQECDDLVLDMVFPVRCRGRKIMDVVDKTLRPLRDRVAHVLLDSNEPSLNLDEAQDVEQVVEWLPLAKFVSRLLILIDLPLDPASKMTL